MFLACLLAAAPGAAAQNSAQTPNAKPARIDWNSRAPWGGRQNEGERKRGTDPQAMIRPPFKVFDNVYYVGTHYVSSYLVTTSAGMVLIDATYAETADSVLDGVRKLGFNPSNIKYILVTHSHLDHFGGAGKIKEVTGARVGMSIQDWQSVEQQQKSPKGRNLGLPLVQDFIMKDNSSLTVGDTTFKFYFTPGHTVGATSIEFPVKDRGKAYRAIEPGGMGVQFGPEWTPIFINSVEKLKQLGPWDVVLGNHPFLQPMDMELDVEKGLETRGNGPNPAIVGPEKINEWFDQILKVASEKQATEQAAEKSAGS